MPTEEELRKAIAGLREVSKPVELKFFSYEYLASKRRGDLEKKLTTKWNSNYYSRLFDTARKQANPYPQDSDWDFGYWFNYYWQEVYRQGAMRTLLWEPYSIVFDYEEMAKDEENQKKYINKPLQQQIVRREFIESIENKPHIGKEVLRALFLMGFETPPVQLIKPASMLFYSEVWMPGLEKKGFTELYEERETGKSKEAIRYAYRGDGRSKEVVAQHLGTRAKADIKYTQGQMNMDQPWHPYSDEGFRNKLWMRKESKDHDYESITSVSQNFGVACAYPMVKLADIELLGPVSGWSVESRRKAKTKYGIKYAEAQNAHGKRELLMASNTNVYVINVTKEKVVVETTRYSGFDKSESGYAERGIRGVRLRDLLAVFTCRRLHHPVSSEELYQSTVHPSTVFLEDFEILTGVGWVTWGTDGYKRFVNNLTTFFNANKNGFDITHFGGAVSKIPSYRILKWETPLWQSKNMY